MRSYLHKDRIERIYLVKFSVKFLISSIAIFKFYFFNAIKNQYYIDCVYANSHANIISYFKYMKHKAPLLLILFRWNDTNFELKPNIT